MRGKWILWGLVTAALMVAPTFGATVDDMQIYLTPGTTWYNGASQQFQPVVAPSMSYAMISLGEISVVGSSSYEYQFDGTLSMTPSGLIESTYEGGLTVGEFNGGITLTINGSLWAKNDPGNKIIENKDILIAQMDSSSWFLRELPHPPNFQNTVRGQSLDFTPVGGELLEGLGDETLRMLGFHADFTFSMSSPTVDGFGTTSYSSTMQPVIQIIPEPATVLLIMAGGAFLVKNKKKK